jgi:hypothetical protein
MGRATREPVPVEKVVPLRGAKRDEETVADHFRFAPCPCIAGHFPDIPFRHPPPVGASFQPFVAPELRAYARRNYAISDEATDSEPSPESPAATPEARPLFGPSTGHH